MRVVISNSDMSYQFGVYATNWNYPLKEKHWEIGIYFWKWSLGLELFKESK